jgi:3-isopropylmalate/(R)-2-methylmalate dehydratase small subunit
MTPFVHLAAVAAPLPMANVDTDQILAGQFLKTLSRQGLGRHLFHALRQDSGFVLDRAPWNEAGILVALDNFGCGSSREHAPWALRDFGIRCLIAPSFADIFANNCVKNGMLTITLPASDIESLLAMVAEPAAARLEIDLPAQTIRTASGRQWMFDIEPQRKQDLLLGTDEIARSMSFGDRISAYEEERRRSRPWLQPGS